MLCTCKRLSSDRTYIPTSLDCFVGSKAVHLGLTELGADLGAGRFMRNPLQSARLNDVLGLAAFYRMGRALMAYKIAHRLGLMFVNTNMRHFQFFGV